jgi:hypothetical protein
VARQRSAKPSTAVRIRQRPQQVSENLCNDKSYRDFLFEELVKDYYKVEYQNTIFFVDTHNARIEYQRNHFAECEKLVEKNIDAGVAAEDDYILKALATRVISAICRS